MEWMSQEQRERNEWDDKNRRIARIKTAMRQQQQLLERLERELEEHPRNAEMRERGETR